jgi:hypothetical protein
MVSIPSLSFLNLLCSRRGHLLRLNAVPEILCKLNPLFRTKLQEFIQ